MPRLYDKLWLVYVSWEHYGAGTFWTYIVSAPSKEIAIGIVKSDPEIEPEPDPRSKQPTGIWSLRAEEVKPEKGLCHLITENSYGGW